MIPSSPLKEILETIFEKESLILAVSSSPLGAQPSQKLTMRPLMIKGERHYQLSEQRDQQVVHHNFSKDEALKTLFTTTTHYKQTFLYTTDADYQVLVNKKGKVTILKKPSSKALLSLQHNREKNYLLADGEVVPFLVELGVMSASGKVHAQKWDKFRQINRFLEMIDDIIVHLERDRTVRIVDFGCGKAYLTFALYHFLKKVKGYQVKITGLDLKADVIKQCQQLVVKLGYEKDLEFILGDINHFETDEVVDMMVSLHACDTATDAALEKAIRWKAKVILCVPCCQHELFSQVKNQDLEPLLKHGILKERFAALVTDAARAQLLEVVGYHTQILEFIDMEHTPKNLLIRAVLRTKNESSSHLKEAFLRFKESLHINPALERFLGKE